MSGASTGDTASSGALFVRYTALGFAVLILGLVGYLGFVVYPRLDLSAGVGAGLIVLAAAAGVASFFSPCSFPLLVGMLGRPLAERAQSGERRQPTRNSLAFATALSLGVVAFLALLGTAIALGGDAIIKDVTFTSTTGRILRITWVGSDWPYRRPPATIRTGVTGFPAASTSRRQRPGTTSAYLAAGFG